MPQFDPALIEVMKVLEDTMTRVPSEMGWGCPGGSACQLRHRSGEEALWLATTAEGIASA